MCASLANGGHLRQRMLCSSTHLYTFHYRASTRKMLKTNEPSNVGGTFIRPSTQSYHFALIPTVDRVACSIASLTSGWCPASAGQPCTSILWPGYGSLSSLETFSTLNHKHLYNISCPFALPNLPFLPDFHFHEIHLPSYGTFTKAAST